MIITINCNYNIISRIFSRSSFSGRKDRLTRSCQFCVVYFQILLLPIFEHNEFDLVEDAGMRSIYRRETRKISDEEGTGRREREETGLLGMAGILFLLYSFPSFSYPSSSSPSLLPSSHWSHGS